MPVDLSEALEYHERGDLDRAARIYEAALAENPDEPDALHLLGLVALQRGDPGRAVAMIGRAVAFRPDDATFHANLAEAWWGLGQLDRVVECCRAALRLEPDNAGVLCNLGSTLVARGEVDAAVGYFREAIRLAPDFGAARNNLGNALRLKGDKIAALEQFRHAVRLDPGSVEGRGHLAELLLELGEPEEAAVDIAGRRSDSAPIFRQPTATSAMSSTRSAGSRRPRPAFARRSVSGPACLPPTRDSPASWRISASSASHRRRSARRFATTPIMPARGPGWRPDSGTSSPTPTGPRSKTSWRTPIFLPTSAGRSCSGWVTRWTPGANSNGPPGSSPRPTPCNEPTSRCGGWDMTRSRIGRSSTG